MKIFDYISEQRNHPTPDTIYKYLIHDIPTLSKTSVYNTMDLFRQHNLVQMITIEENETRFDADTSEHGHFKCLKCGEVYDFRIETSDINNSSSPAGQNLPGFKITERHVYYKGLCSGCSG